MTFNLRPNEHRLATMLVRYFYERDAVPYLEARTQLTKLMRRYPNLSRGVRTSHTLIQFLRLKFNFGTSLMRRISETLEPPPPPQ